MQSKMEDDNLWVLASFLSIYVLHESWHVVPSRWIGKSYLEPNVSMPKPKKLHAALPYRELEPNPVQDYPLV